MSGYKTGQKEYSIEDYDPKWLNKFDSLKTFLQRVFGAKALQIEHVGSTSIVGMRAKPIIDVLLIVPDMKDLRSEKSRMEALGYTSRQNYIADNSLFFCKEVLGKRLALVHVLPFGHPRIASLLDKRDYLRTQPDEARKYQTIKMILAKQFPKDYLSYKKGKSHYLNEELEEKIKKWKRAKST